MNLPFEYDRVAVGRVRRHHSHDRFRQRPRRHPSRAARSHDVIRRRHPQRPARDSRRLVSHGVWDEETETDVHSVGIFTLPEMEFPFATIDEVMGEIRRVAAELVAAGQVSARPGRRALDHAAYRRGGGGEASRAFGTADRRPRRLARLVHGDAAQPRVRDAADARSCADHAGGDSEPVTGRSRRRAGAADHDLLRLQHARRSALD